MSFGQIIHGSAGYPAFAKGGGLLYATAFDFTFSAYINSLCLPVDHSVTIIAPNGDTFPGILRWIASLSSSVTFQYFNQPLSVNAPNGISMSGKFINYGYGNYVLNRWPVLTFKARAVFTVSSTMALLNEDGSAGYDSSYSVQGGAIADDSFLSVWMFGSLKGLSAPHYSENLTLGSFQASQESKSAVFSAEYNAEQGTHSFSAALS